MKKLALLLCCILLPLALTAQERTGNINGIVTDKDGIPLPGVTLTLTGATVAPMSVLSNSEGRFRFLSLHPGMDFSLKAELQGFKSRTETKIIVEAAKNADIKIVMEQGTLEEQVTVVAQTPMIQAKKTQVVTTVGYEQLQSLPSARDPWVFLQLTPAVFIDRENVGGNESGSQSSFVTRGSTNQVWAMDGVNVTDLSSGGSTGYYDFDSFEEMNVATGAFDVEYRSVGTVINLVTRRGGNKTSLAGRFFLTDEQFQGTVSDDKVKQLGVPGYNHVDYVREYGFNVGGPVFKDKVWWWGSYATSQIANIMATGAINSIELYNYDFKINLQPIPQNRFEFFIQAGDKLQFGRSSSLSYPSGWTQRGKYHWGSPTIKFQDEHMFGDNLFVTARYGFTDAGFGMWPGNDEGVTKNTWYDQTRDLVTGGPAGGTGSHTWWFSGRPHHFGVAQIQYFNDNIFGTSHEMKLGFELNNNSAHSVGGFYGSKLRPLYNIYQTTLDWNKDGKNDVVRDLLIAQYGAANAPTYATFSVSRNAWDTTGGTDRYSVYFSDLISIGRLNVTLGLRADQNRQWADPYTAEALLEEQREWGTTDHMDSFQNMWKLQNEIIDLETAKKINAFLPDKTLPARSQQKFWTVFSPTVSLTYDIFGDGKTIAKASYRLFPGTGLGYGVWAPSGTGGSMSFHWIDSDRNNIVNWTELWWRNRGSIATPYPAFNPDGTLNTSRLTLDKNTNWSGFDENNPMALLAPYTKYDLDNYKVSLTHDLTVSLERQLGADMSVSASFSYRRWGRYTKSQTYWPAEFYPTISDPGHLRGAGDYEIVSKVPNTLVDPTTGKVFDPKEAAGRDIYALKLTDYQVMSTDYSWVSMADPTQHDSYWGWDFVFNKRLSKKWMFNANFTWQTQRYYYGENYQGNPTNLWAYDGQMWGSSIGYTSNRVGNTTFFSRWMLKFMGLYQLPWETTISTTFSAHAGGWNAETFGIRDFRTPNQTNGYDFSFPTTGFDNRDILESVYTLNLKVEKMLKIADLGRIYFSVDLFNALNQIPVLRKYDNYYGRFDYFVNGTTGYVAPSATNNKNTEIMNPFCFRLGARFQF